MVERTRVRDRRAGAGCGIAGEILRDRDQFRDFQIPVRAQGLQRGHILLPADVQGVVDGDQPAAVVDQRADLVDQPGAVRVQVQRAFGCRREKGRVHENAVETFLVPFQSADQRPEIPDEEVRLVDRETVQRVRCLGEIEELAVQVELNDAACPARAGRRAQAAGVGEGVQHGLAFQGFDGPSAQVARVEVQAGVPVHRQVEGVPDSVLLHLAVGGFAEEEAAPSLFRRRAVAGFDDARPQPGEALLQKNLRLPHQRQTVFRLGGIVVQDGGRRVQVHGQVGTAFGEAVEQPEGGLVPGVEQWFTRRKGFFEQGEDRIRHRGSFSLGLTTKARIFLFFRAACPRSLGVVTSW